MRTDTTSDDVTEKPLDLIFVSRTTTVGIALRK